MKQSVVNLSDIKMEERFREDYGDHDFEELMQSIKDHGLIHPIAVQSDDGEPPYQLLAGGRRYLAHVGLKRPEIACRIYDRPLDELEVRAIELSENIHRKDLSHFEQAQLTKRINDLFENVHGRKTSTSPNASGWSQNKTAEIVNLTPARVSQHIKIATAAEEYPELELDKCKNISEATKKFDKFEDSLRKRDFYERAKEQVGKDWKGYADRYIVGDFFDGVKKVPDKSVQLVEIDPPYGIDLSGVKKDFESNYYLNDYNEIAAPVYLEFMDKVLSECWRVMSDNSWLILWFGPEPWLEPLYQLLCKHNFKTRRLTGKWIKPGGQTNSPDIYLANCDEQFFYCRKGSPVLNRKGRSNLFSYPPIHHSQKVHPTERPLDLMRDILQTFTIQGSRVMIPFLGSGVTIKACEYEGMYPLGWDLSEENRASFVYKFYKGGAQ